jgi:predicted nucleic acid-binding Zn ribbon protein
MKDLGLSDRMTEEQIIAAWREIVGEFLAGHSKPNRLYEGILYVRVLQSSMMFELERTFRKEILEKLRKRFGRAIRDVRFKMG